MVEYGQAREQDWNCWKFFPSRWQFCRVFEEMECHGDPKLAAGAHKMIAMDCRKHQHGDPYAKFDAGECIASKNLAAVVDPHPANCEKVTQLDGLMPRFESAVQDADREQQERVNAALRQLQGQPVPTFPAPTFTDCEPKLFGGGFFCHSF
jgi:hypothetical protein